MTAPPRQTVFLGGAAMLCAAIFALFSGLLHALVLPMNAAANNFAAYEKAPALSAMRPGVCFLTSEFNDVSYFKGDVCLRLDNGRRNILLIGDSHAAQYYGALNNMSPSINVLQANASGCLPLIGTVGEARCVKLWDHVTREFLPGKKLDAIFMVGRWRPNTASRAYETANILTRFADQVIIIGPNEEFLTSMPKVLTRAALLGNMDLVDRYVKTDTREIEAEFKALDRPSANVTYLSFFETVCGARCPPLSKSGEPLILDDNHVSPSTATDLFAAARPKLAILE